jgi:hypothetical protein
MINVAVSFNQELFILGLLIYFFLVGVASIIMGLMKHEKHRPEYMGTPEIVLGLIFVFWILVCFLV